MCCRACPGYELCRAKGKLAGDDCCTQCRYFDSCMEEPEQEETHHSAPRRAYRPRT